MVLGKRKKGYTCFYCAHDVTPEQLAIRFVNPRNEEIVLHMNCATTLTLLFSKDVRRLAYNQRLVPEFKRSGALHPEFTARE